jgi:phospholipase C
MTARKRFSDLGLMAVVGGLLTLSACGGGSSSGGTPLSSQKIQHVVIIFQENRSPDNLFQDAALISAGADIQNFGINSLGQTIPLTQTPMVTDYDLSHLHLAFTQMYDNGKMDGADKIKVSCLNGGTGCAPPNPWFQYVDPADVQPYFQLAETYTFADRMFQTNQGPSFPAHQFIISGTSAPTAPGQSNSDLFAADLPEGGGSEKQNDQDTGCTAPISEYVPMIGPGGATSKMYPCFDHPTLTDLLNSNNLSWRYYAPSPGSIWTGPNAIKHMCVPNAGGTECTGSDWTNNVVLNYAQVLTDVQNGQLAEVTWVIPNGASSDHAEITDGTGPSWVASVVNAVGNSKFWPNTAIIIAWDDWGGWYDHVAPAIDPTYGYYEYGFRVPMIVVSPYAIPNHISHTVYDFGSILKFIETTFALPNVDPSYADARAKDLSDCFNFNQTPLTFQTISSPQNAAFFIHDKKAPTPPDDDD